VERHSAKEQNMTMQNHPTPRTSRLKQSLVYWCYAQYWTPRQMCQIARDLGCQSIEVIDVEHWPLLKEFGLTCALAGSHSFVHGLNNPANHEKCLAKLREQIDHSAAFGCPNVITFTGNRHGMADDVGMNHTVVALKQIAGQAERSKVNICLEMLNSRVAVDMKGHPDYMGDHIDWCVEAVKRVGSERVKVLFDIYHVQIMDGDVITRLRQHIDYISHIHTAGVPGRFELTGRQEIAYRPIMEELAELNYQGYVGQEFFVSQPTAGSALKALQDAVTMCDV
jgi:hydroxypyruvate isomerase